MSSNVHVILFKSASESESEDEFYTLLQTHFQVTLIPVLDFEFNNLDKILCKLKKPNDYEGIIFSSLRCVTGIEMSVYQGGCSSILKDWVQHKHFAVGEKTGQMVSSLGLLARGTDAGNANKLAEIMSRDHFSKPFLYPKGSLTKDTFKSALEERGIITDDIIIYKTKPHPELELNITNIKSQISEKTVCFVYFSPSGVSFTFPILHRLGFDLNKIKFVAIGDTTAKAILENGLALSATSSKPDPRALMEAVMSVMH